MEHPHYISTPGHHGTHTGQPAASNHWSATSWLDVPQHSFRNKRQLQRKSFASVATLCCKVKLPILTSECCVSQPFKRLEDFVWISNCIYLCFDLVCLQTSEKRKQKTTEKFSFLCQTLFQSESRTEQSPPKIERLVAKSQPKPLFAGAVVSLKSSVIFPKSAWTLLFVTQQKQSILLQISNQSCNLKQWDKQWK